MEDDYDKTIKYLGWLLLAATALLVLHTLTSCKTRYVSVPEYHTIYSSKTDSFFHTDTLREKEWMTIKEVDSAELKRLGIELKNVTSAYVIERNRNTESKSQQQSVRTDTIIKTDSVRIPYPVERGLSAWQKAKMDFGGIAMAATAVCVIAFLVWLEKKKKKI